MSMRVSARSAGVAAARAVATGAKVPGSSESMKAPKNALTAQPERWARMAAGSASGLRRSQRPSDQAPSRGSVRVRSSHSV